MFFALVFPHKIEAVFFFAGFKGVFMGLDYGKSKYFFVQSHLEVEMLWVGVMGVTLVLPRHILTTFKSKCKNNF
jgi:hypothetical protein